MPVRLDAVQPPLAKYLDWHFGSLFSLAKAPALTISSATDDLFDPPDVLQRRDGPVESWDTPGCLWTHHQSGAWAVLRGDQLRIRVAEGPEAWRATRQLLFTTLSWFLDNRGLLLLHAGLISRADRGILLMGPSSSGKSTAAMSALLGGWQLRADDLSVVRVDGAPRAFGVPKRAMVEPAVARLLSDETTAMTEHGRDRVMLASDVFTVGWSELVGVVALAHHEGDGELQRLSHDQALSELVRGFLEAERPDAMRRHLAGLAALAGLPAFQLAHTADPSQRLERSAHLLDEVMAAALVELGAERQ